MAITPRFFSSSVSCNSVFSAPRSLNEAVNCRFSNFTQTSALAMRERVSLRRHGVRTTAPLMRSAACRTSSSVTGSSTIAAFAIVAELGVAFAEELRDADAVAAEAAHVFLAGPGLEGQRLDLGAGPDGGAQAGDLHGAVD